MYPFGLLHLQVTENPFKLALANNGTVTFSAARVSGADRLLVQRNPGSLEQFLSTSFSAFRAVMLMAPGGSRDSLLEREGRAWWGLLLLFETHARCCPSCLSVPPLHRPIWLSLALLADLLS